MTLPVVVITYIKGILNFTISPETIFINKGPTKIVQLSWTPGCSLIFRGAGPVPDIVQIEGKDAFSLALIVNLDDFSCRNTSK
jgi:hypothetical protein